MLSKVRKYLDIPFREKFLLLVLGLLCLYFSLIILIFPFSGITKLLGKKGKQFTDELSEKDYQKVKIVEKNISRLSKHSPVKVKCLAKAMAAKYILKKLKINSTIYIGVSVEKSKKIDAHAWLICSEIIVSGKEEVSRFKSLVFFS